MNDLKAPLNPGDSSVGHGAMKLHQALRFKNRFGGMTFTTLCGRMNAASPDGMNIAATPAEVTCLFCRKDRRFPALSKALPHG